MHGIPILLKENIDTDDDMLTTAGSLALVGSMPAEDSTTASRLRAAGAVLLGKTAMSEWAFFRSMTGTSGWSGRNGQVRNPYDPTRSPGGSSSGSGVAASANFAAAAIGTETDGSIVSPANANGVVGLKPTVGLTSRAGVIPISRSQDSVGPLARTVADAAAVLSAIAGPDPRDPATSGSASDDYTTYLDADGLRGRRIGVATGLFGFSRHADRVARDAIGLIQAAGAVTVDVPELRVGPELRDAEFEILLHEFKAGVEEYLATRTGSSPNTLGEVIAYNLRHAPLELQHFGQDLLEQADARGPLTCAVYLEAVATAARLSRTEGLDRARRARPRRAPRSDRSAGAAHRSRQRRRSVRRHVDTRRNRWLPADLASGRLRRRPPGGHHVDGRPVERTHPDRAGVRIRGPPGSPSAPVALTTRLRRRCATLPP